MAPPRLPSPCGRIAAEFDETIQAKTEEVIAEGQARMDKIIAKYRPRLEGKKVMMMVGGLRPRHIIPAFKDLGMDVISTGYEFAHVTTTNAPPSTSMKAP